MRAWLGAAVLALSPGFTPTGLAQSDLAELIAESRFVAALDQVAREPDPLQRAQNELWVRHHAGDLRGALAVGVAELQAHPADAFLLEQSAFIAISLRRTELATGLVQRLMRLTTSGALSASDAARYAASVGSMDEELRAQLAADDARGEALRLARLVVLSTLGVVTLLTGYLAWSTGRPSA